MQSENFIPKIRAAGLSTSTCFPKTFSRVAKWCIIPLLCKPDSHSKLARKLANSQPIQSPPRIRSQKEENSQHAIHGGHPLILYNLYAREPRAFSDISKETRPTRFPLSPHTSRTVSAVTVCLFIKTRLGGGLCPYSTDEFISRTRSLSSLSYLSRILCIAPCNGVQRPSPCDE